MKRFALACSLLLALPAVALADGDYRYELTPQISYHFGGSIDVEGSTNQGSKYKLSDGVAWGASFDIPLSNNLQLELLASQQKSDLFIDKGLFGPDLDLSSIDVDYFHVGLLLQFGRPAVTSYFVGSAGATILDPKGHTAGSDTKFSVSAGGGVKAFFTEHVGLRFEGRYFWTQLDNTQAACTANGGCYNYRDYLSQFHTTVGLIFAW